jgi:hypothetical protein
MSSAKSLFKTVFTDWSEDQAPRLGAALAYYAAFNHSALDAASHYCREGFGTG